MNRTKVYGYGHIVGMAVGFFINYMYLSVLFF
jgi:hypothetical protein